MSGDRFPSPLRHHWKTALFCIAIPFWALCSYVSLGMFD